MTSSVDFLIGVAITTAEVALTLVGLYVVYWIVAKWKGWI